MLKDNNSHAYALAAHSLHTAALISFLLDPQDLKLGDLLVWQEIIFNQS